MPEGDTVWRTCRRLNEVLAGRVLTRSEFRVPSLATTDLTGVGIREVISRGKHQMFRFSNEFTLHTHFRMDGVWKIYARGRSWSGGPAFQIRAVASEPTVNSRVPSGLKLASKSSPPWSNSTRIGARVAAAS